MLYIDQLNTLYICDLFDMIFLLLLYLRFIKLFFRIEYIDIVIQCIILYHELNKSLWHTINN